MNTNPKKNDDILADDTTFDEGEGSWPDCYIDDDDLDDSTEFDDTDNQDGDDTL